MADHSELTPAGRGQEPPGSVAELVGHPLFRAADVDRYRHVLPHICVQDVRRGTSLSSSGETSRPFHLVLRGRLRAYVMGQTGRRLVLDLIEAGGFDGILPVTGHEGHRTEVTEDARLASMGLRTLQKLTAADPQIVTNLLRLVAARLSRREEHLETIALYESGAGLARQLLALGRTFGTHSGDWIVLQHRLTHQLIADMLGIRRETVTLHLGQLAALGAVRFSGGRCWLDAELLQRLATLQPGPAHMPAEPG